MNINAEILGVLRRHAGDDTDYQNVTVQAKGLIISHDLQSLSDLVFTKNGIEIECGEDTDRIRIHNGAAQDMNILEEDQKTTCLIRSDSWTAIFTFAWLAKGVVKLPHRGSF